MKESKIIQTRTFIPNYDIHKSDKLTHLLDVNYDFINSFVEAELTKDNQIRQILNDFYKRGDSSLVIKIKKEINYTTPNSFEAKLVREEILIESSFKKDIYLFLNWLARQSV